MKRVVLCLFAHLVVVSTLFAQAPAESNAALRAKAEAAIDKGLGYLSKEQKDDGSWTSADFPGLTGLIVQSYLSAPGGKHRKDDAAQKGLVFIRKSARPDGGIYAGRMGNYNTSLCLSTLILEGDAGDAAIIDAAHGYLVGAQTKNSANPANNGGFGYEAGGSGRQTRPDLDNTVFALEALRRYRDAQKGKEASPKEDLNWQAALDFVARCQRPASGPADDKGGFTYTPESGDESGGPVHSYGTMTYAGVLSFIYADMKKDDPRVVAALDWIAHHYTVEENPGQGNQGLYYYYEMMAKGLSAAGVEKLATDSGAKVDWRADLTNKLLSLQKPDGSWSSENGRWMEKDPNLVTAYCILALSFVHEGLQ